MERTFEKRNIIKSISKSNNRQRIHRKRTNRQTDSDKIRITRFPSIDFSYLENSSFEILNRDDIDSLRFLKTLAKTKKENKNDQFNDLLNSIKVDDTYALSYGKLINGSPCIIIPVVYKTFDYGMGIIIWNFLKKAKENKANMLALREFIKVCILNFGYDSESEFDDMFEDELYESHQMNNNLEDKKESSANIKRWGKVKILSKRFAKTKLPKKKETYINHISSSTYSIVLKKLFIDAWDLYINMNKYGIKEGIDDGLAFPHQSMLLFYNEKIYDRMSPLTNMIYDNGVCDFVYEYIIAKKEDLADIQKEDKELENYFKWYDKLSNLW